LRCSTPKCSRYYPKFLTHKPPEAKSSIGIVTVPLSALHTASGLRLTAATPFTFSVLAFDNYYTGNLTDLIGPMQYELDLPQVFPFPADLTAAANTSTPVQIFPNRGNSPSETGLLLMYTGRKAGQEASFVTVKP
jgi:hypothetical protein